LGKRSPSRLGRCAKLEQAVLVDVSRAGWGVRPQIERSWSGLLPFEAVEHSHLARATGQQESNPRARRYPECDVGEQIDQVVLGMEGERLVDRIDQHDDLLLDACRSKRLERSCNHAVVDIAGGQGVNVQVELSDVCAGDVAACDNTHMLFYDNLKPGMLHCR
jgi:hypothetical protein